MKGMVFTLSIDYNLIGGLHMIFMNDIVHLEKLHSSVVFRRMYIRDMPG